MLLFTNIRSEGDIKSTKNIWADGHIGSKKNISVHGDIVFTGTNKWILHTPDDGRSAMSFAPYDVTNDKWDWTKSYTFDKGNIKVAGNINATGNIIAGGNVTGHTVSGTYGLDMHKWNMRPHQRPEDASPSLAFRDTGGGGESFIFGSGKQWHAWR